VKEFLNCLRVQLEKLMRRYNGESLPGNRPGVLFAQVRFPTGRKWQYPKFDVRFVVVTQLEGFIPIPNQGFVLPRFNGMVLFTTKALLVCIKAVDVVLHLKQL
jgi:hypothetical protein